jgi:hypothetical protein
LKKPTGSIRFWFYKHKTEKTELNRTEQKKQSQTEKTKPNRKNRAKHKPAGLNQFRFFFKFGLVTFFYKSQTEPKMITPSLACSARLSF